MADSELLLELLSWILILGAAVLHLIGFSSPHWLSVPMSNSGLWKVCFEGICGNYVDLSYLPGFLRATQLFQTVGLLCILGSFVLQILTIAIDSSRKKPFKVTTAALTFLAGSSIILGVAIYASHILRSNLSWAFAMSTTGGLMSIMAGALISFHVYTVRHQHIQVLD